MRTIYYYELKLRVTKGKKKLTEHVKLDYAVSSAESEADILTGHTWDRMYRSYYGPRYDGKVDIQIEEVLSKKAVGTKYEVKRNCTADLTKVRDAYYEAIGYPFTTSRETAQRHLQGGIC